MKNKKILKYCIITIGIVLIATVAILLYFLDYDSFMCFLGVVIGGILLGLGIKLMVVNLSCKKTVSAVLVEYGFEQFKGHLASSPIFTYQYQGKTYTEKSAECLSQRYALKHFKKGETYTVYVSEKKPSFVKIRRSVRAFDVFLVIVGFVFIVLSVIAVFLP